MSYKEAFDDRTEVLITKIKSDDSGVTVPTNIAFTPNDNPDISIDVSGRFSTHEIIGGKTVRQKIGSDPPQISVNGVCNEKTAKSVDQLRAARTGIFISERISMRVHFASASTDPLESGGAVDASSGDMLYTYRLNLVGLEDFSPDELDIFDEEPPLFE